MLSTATLRYIETDPHCIQAYHLGINGRGTANTKTRFVWRVGGNVFGLRTVRAGQQILGTVFDAPSSVPAGVENSVQRFVDSFGQGARHDVEAVCTLQGCGAVGARYR